MLFAIKERLLVEEKKKKKLRNYNLRKKVQREYDKGRVAFLENSFFLFFPHNLFIS